MSTSRILRVIALSALLAVAVRSQRIEVVGDPRDCSEPRPSMNSGHAPPPPALKRGPCTATQRVANPHVVADARPKIIGALGLCVHVGLCINLPRHSPCPLLRGIDACVKLQTRLRARGRWPAGTVVWGTHRDGGNRV